MWKKRSKGLPSSFTRQVLSNTIISLVSFYPLFCIIVFIYNFYYIQMMGRLIQFLLFIGLLQLCKSRMQFTFTCEPCKKKSCGTQKCMFARDRYFQSQICVPNYDCSVEEPNPEKFQFGNCSYGQSPLPCSSGVCRFYGSRGCLKQFSNISTGLLDQLYYSQSCGGCTRSNCSMCLKVQYYRTYYEICLGTLQCKQLGADFTLLVKKCQRDIFNNPCNFCYNLQNPSYLQLTRGVCIQKDHYLHNKEFLQYVLSGGAISPQIKSESESEKKQDKLTILLLALAIIGYLII